MLNRNFKKLHVSLPLKRYLMLFGDKDYELDKVAEEKDLGVVFVSSLKFTDHI